MTRSRPTRYGAVAQKGGTVREGQAQHDRPVEHPVDNRFDVGDRTPTRLSFSRVR